MASRSGYKGFKKLLPGLKILRPGTLGIDNDVLIPELNKTFFPRSEQAVLGARNLAVPLKSLTNINVTLNTDSNGVTTVTGTANEDGGRLSLCSQPFTLKAGTYNIHTYTTGTSGAFVLSNNDTQGVITITDNKFILSADAKLVGGLSVNNGTAYNGTFAYMITVESDTDPAYAPYAMTNRELTEKTFRYVDYLTSKDLNTITETGFYKLGGSITNGPGVNYGFLEVFKTDANNITQIVHGLSTGEFIYSRRYYNSAWTSWYKFTGTEVS